MKLIIPAAIERKLNAYVQAVDGEIAGMGKVEMRDDNNAYVVDIAIYDQEVTSGTANLDPQSLAMFQTELIKKGESPRDWYLWWHSHSSMGAFFSQIDTGTIASSTEFDHLISLVVNKKRERVARVDTHRPFRMFMDKITVEIAPHVSARSLEIEAQISALMDELGEIQADIPGGIESVEEEVKAKVRSRVYSWERKGYQGSMGFHGGRHQKGDRSYLQEEFDESWSKKRKKDGAVTTGQGIIEKVYDKDELELLIEDAITMIKAHVANGNGDSVECVELRADLRLYCDELMNLQAKPGEQPDWADYWDGHSWRRYDEDEFEDAGELPALPAPYKYGFSS